MNFTSLTLTGDGYVLLSTPLSLTNGMTNAGTINSLNTLRAQVQPRASQTSRRKSPARPAMSVRQTVADFCQ